MARHTETSTAKRPQQVRDVALAAMSPKYARKKLDAMDPQPSKHTMLRALLWLKKENHTRQADILWKYILWRFPSLEKRAPTRFKPSRGDVRPYSTQSSESGLFARIPVELLGVQKGADVIAEFCPAIMPAAIIVRAPIKQELGKLAKRRGNYGKEGNDEESGDGGGSGHREEGGHQGNPRRG